MAVLLQVRPHFLTYEYSEVHGGYFDLNKHVFQEMVALHQYSDIYVFIKV